VYTNFSLDEQANVLKVQRCNNHLDVTKLTREFPSIVNVKKACEDVFIRLASARNGS
jgi:hypothetical protein